MERLPQMLAAKRRIWARYERELKGLRGLGPLPLPPDGGSACWLAGITLSPPAPPPAELQQMLRERGIEARTFWKPVHRQPPYRDAPASPMPVAEAVWPTVLSLPCSTDLSEGDQGRVIAALHELLS
jgi:dTDP-4-amino-4,6-dideoxygalactose transaminase